MKEISRFFTQLLLLQDAIKEIAKEEIVFSKSQRILMNARVKLLFPNDR